MKTEVIGQNTAGTLDFWVSFSLKGYIGGQQLYHQIYRKMICLATNCYLEKIKKNLLLLILNF